MFLIFHKESPVSFARKQTQGRHQSWPLWEPSTYSPLSRSTLLIPVFNIFRPCRIVCVTSIILYNIIIVHIHIWEKNTGKGEEEERVISYGDWTFRSQASVMEDVHDEIWFDQMQGMLKLVWWSGLRLWQVIL